MNWEGFLMGVSDFGLERMKEERNLRMQKHLEELREKRAEALEIRREDRAASRKKEERSTTRDDALRQTEWDEATGTGTVSDFAIDGTPLGTRAMTSTEAQSMRNAEQDRRMKQAESQSQIDYRKGSLANDAARLGLERQRLSDARAAQAVQSSAEDLGSMTTRDRATLLVQEAGYKPPTGGDPLSTATYARTVDAAEQALLWGLQNNADKQRVQTVFGRLLQDPGYMSGGRFGSMERDDADPWRSFNTR